VDPGGLEIDKFLVFFLLPCYYRAIHFPVILVELNKLFYGSVTSRLGTIFPNN
jgi:hypothetical protein